jgi:hypothetical protein
MKIAKLGNQINEKELAQQCAIHVVVVPKGTLVCEHPLDKRASVKSHGKDFCWECGDYITN